jgi:hypothetical protein
VQQQVEHLPGVLGVPAADVGGVVRIEVLRWVAIDRVG